MEPWHYGKCAFCEAPLAGNSEIEHFRSKSRYPLAAFVWRNLFLICRKCNQAKGEKEHAGCVKPDCEDPTNYLWINPISRKMEPKPGISEEARERAVKTIRCYDLDRAELTKLYETYLLKSFFPEQLSLIRLIAQTQEHKPEAAEQIPSHLDGLRALSNPNQPFSLMAKSLLEYYEIR